jgi:hypothetical protein
MGIYLMGNTTNSVPIHFQNLIQNFSFPFQKFLHNQNWQIHEEF